MYLQFVRADETRMLMSLLAATTTHVKSCPPSESCLIFLLLRKLEHILL